MWYTMMGIIIVFVVGTVVSLLTEPPARQNTNPVLFTPFMRKYVKDMNSRRYGTTDPAEEELMNKILRK
jgi:hypothetical protein